MSDIRNLVNQMVSRYMGNSGQSPLTLPAVNDLSVGADDYARKHKPATGQLGLFEKPSEKQKPLFSKKVDDEAGRWVTMRGARVFISGDDGRVLKGPKRLMGKTKEMIERESAGKGEGTEKPPMPKGLAEMGRIKGGRKDNRQKGLFEEINPGFKWDEDEDVKSVSPKPLPSPAGKSEEADGELFALSGAPSKSPAKPVDIGKADGATKQGALFDSGKGKDGKGDLPGQELLFNSDAGDVGNPKTMENRVQGEDEKPTWKTTKKEFSDTAASRVSGQSVPKTRKLAETVHKMKVREAVESGESVPAEVLADYPDLAKPKPESNPSPAKKKYVEKPSAESIQSHLDNDDHKSAFEAFSKLKKDEVDKVARQVLGMGFYNKSKAQMLEALKRTLPLATKTASEEAQKQDEISYAEMKLRKAKENQKQQSEGMMGAPIRPGVPEIAYSDPHGEGRAEVAKAWQAEVDDAQRELDRVRSVKDEEKPTEKPKAKKQPGEQFKHRVKEDFDLAVSRIDKYPNWVEFTMHNQHPNPDFQKELIRHISGKHPELFESIKSRGKSNMGIKFAIKSLEEDEPKSASPDKYSREQLVAFANSLTDKYVRGEVGGFDIPVDKYAHPLIHAAVGGLGHMAVQSLVKNTTLRRIAHAAVASAMAAWMASANAGQGPSSSPAVNQPAVSAPASPFARQQSGNRSIDAIVNQAFQNHQQAVAEAKAEKGIPADPVQAVPHSVSNTTGARAPGVKPLRGEDEPKSANPSTSPAGKGEGFTDNEHPRHPAGAPESKGGEFAPKGGVEPGSESGSESPRNYPDNLNKPADQQTNYSPPERSIEGLAGDSGNDEPKSLEQKIAEHRMKLASQKSAPEPKASRRDDPDTSWKRAMNFGTERVQASKDAKSQERKAKKQQEQQAKQQEQAVSFDPDQLEREAESSMADADSDASSFDSKPKSEDFKREKDYQRALKAWKREKGASKASITKKIAKSVVPEIATEYELDHSELESAVNDAIAMESEGHKRQEEARKYVTDRGYNAGRINRNEDSGKDHSSTSLDEFASEWAGLYPEIAGSDESQWVDRMWNLAKAGKQDAPSSGDEGFVRKVAERLHGQKMAGGDSSPFPADSDSDSEPDPGPIHGQVGDVDFTPFHRKSLAKELGLLVDKYLREHLVT